MSHNKGKNSKLTIYFNPPFSILSVHIEGSSHSSTAIYFLIVLCLLLKGLIFVTYPISGQNHARARSTLLSRGMPVLLSWLKQALLGIVRNKSFSICLDVDNASLLDAFTISLQLISEASFFSKAPVTYKKVKMRKRNQKIKIKVMKIKQKLNLF